MLNHGVIYFKVFFNSWVLYKIMLMWKKKHTDTSNIKIFAKILYVLIFTKNYQWHIMDSKIIRYFGAKFTNHIHIVYEFCAHHTQCSCIMHNWVFGIAYNYGKICINCGHEHFSNSTAIITTPALSTGTFLSITF